MNEELGLLIQLQRIDAQLSKFGENEQNYRNKIEEEKKVLQALKDKMQETQACLESISKERRDKEKDIEIQEQLVAKTQSRLKEIKTNKEYQAHLHEIDALKKGRGAMEEAVLVLMDKMEVLKNEMDIQEKGFRERESRFLEQVKEVENKLSKMLEDKSRMERDRRSLSEKISKKILEQYEHLLLNKKGSAIAPLQGSTCMGCYMNLPPQLVAEVKRNDKLLTCSHCYRILYWQDFYFPKTA